MRAGADRLAALCEVDAQLGDPRDPANPCGFAAAVDRDEGTPAPAGPAAVLGARLRRSFIPASLGGESAGLDVTLALARVAARRDPAVMPATMFGVTAASCVFLAGDDAQQRRVTALLERGASIGFALSESEHGADLLANTTTATTDPDSGGWRLDGEKWLVGSSEPCEALLVVARTGGRGPGGFTALLVEGEAAALAREEIVRSSGMRTVRLQSYRFADSVLPADATVGTPGHGLEIALRAMQTVRALSTACNLACGDTGLRLAVDFAQDRRFRGRPVTTLPPARRELATAGALLLAAEDLTMGAARALHLVPGAGNLWTAAAKLVATESSAELLDRCADVLGSRSVLASGPLAAFDVIRRDNAVVRHIDTGPAAVRRLLAAEFPRLAAADAPPQADLDALATLLDPQRDLPALQPEALGLVGRGPDPVLHQVNALAAAAREVEGRPGEDLRPWAVERIDELERAIGDTLADLRAPVPPDHVDDLAVRVAVLLAAAVCLARWTLVETGVGATVGANGWPWLAATLSVLLPRAAGNRPALRGPVADAVLDVLLDLHERDLPFSALPVPA